MTPLAILFMIIAMIVIWGGLAVAIVFLAKHPLEDDDAPAGAPGPTRATRR